MLKTVFLATAMTISVPAFAQDMPQPGQVSPNGPTTQPVTSATPPATPPVETPTQPSDAPAAATPADDTQAAATPTTTAQPATTTAQPATGAAQIAQVVDTEFPSYDKDSNGDLSKVEFGAWMVALKTASEPATKATDVATRTWVGNAFASADLDKSSAVSKDELTTFLSQGAK